QWDKKLKKPYFLGYGFSIDGQRPKTPLNDAHGPKNQNPDSDRPPGPNPFCVLVGRPAHVGGRLLQQWTLSPAFQIPEDIIGVDALFLRGPTLYGCGPWGTAVPVQKPKIHSQAAPIPCKGCPCGL